MYYLILIMLVVVSGSGVSVSANFFHYDDGNNLLVYVQADRDIRNFLNYFFNYAEQTGGNISTLYIAGDFWPEKWYLRDFKIRFETDVLNKCNSLINKTCRVKYPKFRNYEVIVIDKKDRVKLEKFIDIDKYEVVEFDQRTKMYKRAYFKKVE